MLNFQFSFGQFKNSCQVCYIKKSEKMNFTMYNMSMMMWKFSAEDTIV